MALIILWVWGLSIGAWAQLPPALSTNAVPDSLLDEPAEETLILPEFVPDPLEPVNRVIWSFNRGVLTGVVKPTGKVYRFIVIKPLRTGIRNLARNVTYPGRLINNLLQGKWSGAREETYRFLGNTLVGAGGLFDVASQWKIPKSDEDFGQTFGHWGWEPNFFLMLPIIGPSNDRDTVGLAADSAADPLRYYRPYRYRSSRPLTYLSPYGYFNAGARYNQLAESVDQYVRFIRAEKDPYSKLQYAWSFARETWTGDENLDGEQDPALLETLQSSLFSFQDPRFPERGRTRSVLIPTTGRRLKFTCWLQPRGAPVVYIVPGLGTHRLAEPVLALAELVYRRGFSAICLSSVFNFDFMEQASTAAVPGYAPVDARDLLVAMTEIDRRLEKLYPGRMKAKALLGYSMGGFHALFMAAHEREASSTLIEFDRYVAINAPVQLLYGIAKLDEFYQAPLNWSPKERAGHIENTVLKAASLVQQSQATPTILPFNVIESRYLIGLSFRLILRDAIFSSQQRTNLGVLDHAIRRWRREPLYREILQYSYRDYFEQFVIPYYLKRGVDLAEPETLENISDLRTYTEALQTNPRIRLLENQNDFLLSEQDLEWLRNTFSSRQLTLFPRGGHLGNLVHPSMQKAILEALEGLRPPPASPGSP